MRCGGAFRCPRRCRQGWRCCTTATATGATRTWRWRITRQRDRPRPADPSPRRELAHRGATWLDPQRACPPAQLALAVEDRGTRLPLAILATEAPADERARLADVHAPIHVRAEFREQHHALIRRHREIARAVERCRHELGAHF